MKPFSDQFLMSHDLPGQQKGPLRGNKWKVDFSEANWGGIIIQSRNKKKSEDIERNVCIDFHDN